MLVKILNLVKIANLSPKGICSRKHIWLENTTTNKGLDQA